MAAAFGGGSSQSAFGARAGATVLSKATAILAVLFMVGAMALAIIGQRGPGSLLSGGTPGAGARLQRLRPHAGNTRRRRRRHRRTPAPPAGDDPAGRQQPPATPAPVDADTGAAAPE